MSDRVQAFLDTLGRLAAALAAATRTLTASAYRARGRLIVAALLGALAYGLYTHPPFAAVRRGEVLVRTDVLDGSATAYGAGTVFVLPGIYQVRRFSTRD